MPTDRVDILIRARDAFSRVLKKATTQLKDVKVSAAGLRQAFLAVTLSLGGLTIALVKMFKIGANVLETQSKFNTVFGESATKVDAFAESFGKLAGLTKSQAQAQLATTAAIAQGMGLASDASADFAIAAIQLAGDLTSFNDVPIAETALAIQSAVTGERESLKRLGIVILDVDVKKKALALTGKTLAAELTNEEKAAATLVLISEKAGVAIGDLSRTQTSAANVARQVQREFAQIAETVSVQVLPALAGFLPILKEIAEAIAPIAEGLASMAINLTDALGVTSTTKRTEAARIGRLDVAGLKATLPGLQAEASALTARAAQERGTIGARLIRLVHGKQPATDTEKELIAVDATIDLVVKRMQELETASEGTAAAIKKVTDQIGATAGPGVSVARGTATSFVAGPLAARVGAAGLGAAATRGGVLANELAVFQQNAQQAADAVNEMGDAVTDNFFRMAQAGISGTAAMEEQMVRSMTNILQTLAGGGIAGALIGGIGGLVGSLFGGGRNRVTPVRIESYGSEALSQREREDFKQAIFIEIVSSIDDTTLAQFEYHLSRRQQLDGVPRIPVRLGG